MKTLLLVSGRLITRAAKLLALFLILFSASQTRAQYCTPGYTFKNAGIFINGVSLGNIDNQNTGGYSTLPNYTYYSNLSTNLIMGHSYTLSFQTGTGPGKKTIHAWIDWNRNGTFDSTETLGETQIKGAFVLGSFVFTVPNGLTAGISRLRIRVTRYDTINLDPCATYSKGEAEDYNVNLVDCSIINPPSIGVTGTLAFCPVNNVTFSAEGLFASWLWSTGETTSSITVSTTQTITLTGTTNLGCVTTSSPVATLAKNCCPMPTNLSVSSMTGTSASVAWSISGSVDSFMIKYREVGASNFIYQKFPNNGNTATINNLHPASNYEWYIRSFCGMTSDYLDAPATFTTPDVQVSCIIPYGMSSGAVTATTGIANWNSHVTADSFMVRFTVNGTGSYVYRYFSGENNFHSATLTGLMPNTIYSWRVRSICNGVHSSYGFPDQTFTTLPARLAHFSDVKEIPDLKIYPNPASKITMVEFNAYAEESYSIRVMELSGRLAQQFSSVSQKGLNKVELDVSDLPKGVYLLTLKTGEHGLQNLKLMIE